MLKEISRDEESILGIHPRDFPFFSDLNINYVFMLIYTALTFIFPIYCDFGLLLPHQKSIEIGVIYLFKSHFKLVMLLGSKRFSIFMRDQT